MPSPGTLPVPSSVRANSNPGYIRAHAGVGFIDANMKLSDARAAVVVRALVADYGISATRLKGYGVGPLAPVASNDSEEGKAKNRRVELVKQ